MQTDYQRLFQEVERKAGRPMQTPKDFQWLEKRMFDDIHETISASTLMRLWGYRSGGVPRQTTLDVLARFVGFEDYVQFCKQNRPSAPSKPPRGEASYLSPSGETERGRWLLWSALLLLAVVGGFTMWHFTKQVPLEEGLPAGAKDMTYLISNPTCNSDELDAWTFGRGGKTLVEDSTLGYYMKRFDVYQVIHGLPAGEYELRVKALQLPYEQETALFDYNRAEDKEDGCACTDAEIYAGPFSKRVKNYYSEAYQQQGKWDNALRFVCLDDSVRIGFRSNHNCRRSSYAVADDFRLFLIRKAKTKAELQELEALRDSALTAYNARNYPDINLQLSDYWMGDEAPMPKDWLTEQDESCCRLVRKTDVGRGFGDSEIYLEYLSQKPAKPGLILGKKIYLKAGKYLVGACVFARDKNESGTNVEFAIKGFDGGFKAVPMMDYHMISIELSEPQELTFGLWAPEGSNVYRTGICQLDIAPRD